MSWQRIAISTGASVGDPGPLPDNLVGLAPETLANLPAAFLPETLSQSGLEDTGFVEVADPPPPPTVPQVVSRMQLRRHLLTMDRTDGQTSAGKLRDQIDAGIAASGDPDLIEYWNDTGEFHRHHAKVEAMLAVFGITDAQADAAWSAAAQLS